MSNKKIIAAALGLAALIAGAQVEAAAYAGVAVGQSHWNMDCMGAVGCKKNVTSYKVTGGYEIDQAWAVEASYFDLGKVTASWYPISSASTATGADVAAVLRMPISSGWSLRTKVGLAYIRGKTAVTMRGYNSDATSNSPQLVAGFGISYKLSDKVHGLAELESRRVKLVDGDGGSGGVFSLSLGIQVGF
jgi:OOP family OmpA-OmpF porin